MEKPIFAFIGRKKSGKTAIISFLVSKLQLEGFKVAVVKHIHHSDFKFDVEGKDTWRFTHAGAKIVAGLSPGKSFFIEENGCVKGKLFSYLNYISGREVDAVFLEGFKEDVSDLSNILKVILARNLEELNSLLEEVKQPIIFISGSVASNLEAKEFKGIELIDFRSGRMRILEKVKKFILAQRVKG